MPPAKISLQAWANPIVAEDMRHLRAQLPEASRLDSAAILVTGAAGFLGCYVSHFLCHLTDEGVRLFVDAFDKLLAAVEKSSASARR